MEWFVVGGFEEDASGGQDRNPHANAGSSSPSKVVCLILSDLLAVTNHGEALCSGKKCSVHYEVLFYLGFTNNATEVKCWSSEKMWRFTLNEMDCFAAWIAGQRFEFHLKVSQEKEYTYNQKKTIEKNTGSASCAFVNDIFYWLWKF